MGLLESRSICNWFSCGSGIGYAHNAEVKPTSYQGNEKTLSVKPKRIKTNHKTEKAMRKLLLILILGCLSLSLYAQQHPTLYAIMDASEKGSDGSVSGVVLATIVDIPDSSEKHLILAFSDTNVVTVPIVESEQFYESLPGQDIKLFCHHMKCVGLESEGVREIEVWTFYKDPDAFAAEKPLGIWISNGETMIEGSDIKVIEDPGLYH